MKISEPPIIVEQKFDLSIDVIWKSITDVHEMKQCIFDNIPDFKAKVVLMVGIIL
ncbi:hypothetical protein [Psychroserpens sp.]|uniref:hypothetical protein n=1 Tax=Psychroserpens sp. TaxID=2020870 RepID=UPI00385A0EE2